MEMRDTTLEANERAEMQDYYMHHAESPDARWALAVEHVRQDRYNVSVLYRETGWDVYGTVRYWAFDDRALAEAQYLQLQGIFKELDEGISIKSMVRNLPEEEAHWHDEE